VLSGASVERVDAPAGGVADAPASGQVAQAQGRPLGVSSPPNFVAAGGPSLMS
jgi:hypothetical protein